MKIDRYKIRSYNPTHKAYYSYYQNIKPCKSYKEFVKTISDFAEFLSRYLVNGYILTLPYNCGHLFVGSTECGKIRDKIKSKKLGYDVYLDNSNTNGRISKITYIPTIEDKGQYSKENILAKCWKFKPTYFLGSMIIKKFLENNEMFIPLDKKKHTFFKEYCINKNYNEFE